MGLPIEFYKAGSGAFEQYLDTQQAKADRGFEMAKMLTPMFVEEYDASKKQSEKANKNLNLLYDTLGSREDANALINLHEVLLTSDDVVSDANTYLNNYGGLGSEQWGRIVTDLGTEDPTISATDRYNNAKNWLTKNVGIGEQAFDFINQEHMPTEEPTTEVTPTDQQPAPIDQQPVGTQQQIVQDPEIDSEDRVVKSTDIYGNNTFVKFSEHPYYKVFYEVWKNETAAFAGDRTPFIAWMSKEVSNPDYNPDIEDSITNPKTVTNEEAVISMFANPDSQAYSPSFVAAKNAEQVSQESQNVTSDEASQFIIAISGALERGDTEQAEALYNEAVSLGFDSDVLHEMMS